MKQNKGLIIIVTAMALCVIIPMAVSGVTYWNSGRDSNEVILNTVDQMVKVNDNGIQTNNDKWIRFRDGIAVGTNSKITFRVEKKNSETRDIIINYSDGNYIYESRIYRYILELKSQKNSDEAMIVLANEKYTYDQMMEKIRDGVQTETGASKLQDYAYICGWK